MEMDSWRVFGVGAAVIGLASAGFYLGYRCGRRRSEQVPQKNLRKSNLLQDDVSQYLRAHNVVDDPVLKKLREASVLHARGRMTSSIEESILLTQLGRALGARKAIDVGVFFGCSAYAIALGLQKGGRVVACDVSSEYTSQGKPFWEEGGVAEKIDLRIQPAVQTLQELIDNGESETYDLMFIDADKVNYMRYYEMGLQLIRRGGMIVVDNTLWSGKVADPGVQDEETVAIRELNDRMSSDSRVSSVMLNLSDGVTIAQKL